MKIVNLNNVIYEININEINDVLQIKKKLSVIIQENYDNIGLVYKNRILYDDTNIKDYNIAEDDFVLLCLISGDSNHIECDQVDSVVIESVTNEQLDIYQSITINLLKYNNEMLSVTIKSYETIFDVLKSICHNMNIVYFIYKDQLIDTTRSFYDYDINEGDTIIMKMISKDSIDHFITINLQSLNNNYQSSLIYMIPNSNVDALKDYFSKLIDIPSKNILLFNDSEQRHNLSGLNIISQPMKIYYDIVADFEDIIKCNILGRGTYGSVFKCVELHTKKVFAIKEFIFNDDNNSDTNAFHKEIAILCSLGNHPNIVKFERKLEKGTSLYILMEYVDGGSLGNYLKINGPLTELEIIKNSKEILEALKYLHSLHIVHRDVKGDNVLLDSTGNIKLCDFSVSKVLIHVACKGFLHGAAKSLVGTANWMAPEIINGQKYTTMADIWSFGATVLEMLTGKPPYNHLEYYSVIYKIGLEKKIDYEVPLNFHKNYLQTFINCCLRSNPSDRLTPTNLLLHPFLQI